MSSYTAPLSDLRFALHDVLKVEPLFARLGFTDATADVVDAVLEEAGRFSATVLAPLNSVGDEIGCVLDQATGEVTTPPGFKQAYDQFVDGGWTGLTASPELGGQGLPHTLGVPLNEMINAANLAWGNFPLLSHGAIEALKQHGEAWQHEAFLKPLIEGRWTGTMCLTEPHCGTDLGLLRTKAVPQADGTYKITGAKIFISAGEHDMAENIVHLVLARLPDAPEGSKGISLFAVPKYNVNADGSLGSRNGIYCGGLEHKMGIHGNATCQMVLEDAVGTLVGKPHRGLPAMFVMMNGARLGVGNQSLGLTQVAYENAVNYAKDRVQMRALSGPKRPDLAADPIIVHPDVRKMLLTARAYAEGARALVYFVAVELDKAHNHPDEAVRKASDDLVALLTPIVKAFITDNAYIATTHCQQVFGGHGYIHEWGMEQFVRDSRINMIYEGTNTVQSLDLLGRKVLGDGGAKLTAFGKIVGRFVKANADNEALQEFTKPLADLGQKVQAFTMEIGMKGMQNPDEVGAAAVDYLRVVGHLVFSYLFAQSAKIALEKQNDSDPFYKAKLSVARFYFAKLLPEVETAMITAKAGLKPLSELDEALF